MYLIQLYWSQLTSTATLPPSVIMIMIMIIILFRKCVAPYTKESHHLTTLPSFCMSDGIP